MAGKPELSVSQQTQAQGVQNVVVYVSNDNIAQAYATAVGQQHIGAQNGLVYGGQAQPTTNYPKGLVNKTLVKSNEVNGLIDGGFYQGATSTIIPQNGFAQNIQSFQNNVNQTGQVLNSNYGGTTVKNVIGYNGSVGEVYPTGSIGKQKSVRDESGTVVESYVAAQSADGSFVTVMGAEATGSATSVVFPRCDSVRSEAAESSCSSLSSGDSPGDGVASSGFVLLPGNSSQPSSDVVVYEGSVSVRPGQPLVLAMVPPGSVSQQQQQHEFTTIPLGWKRLISNGVVIYISPSNTVLSSMDQVKEYLMTQGTCKCGLECPLKCDIVFNFDPKVLGKPCILTPDTNIGDLTKLCNHKRKLLAMTCSASSPSGAVAGTTLTVGAGGVGVVGPKPSTPVTGMAGSNPPAGNGANTTGTTPSPPDPNKLLRKDGSMKRKKRKIGGPYSGISVSQLLAQREKMALAQQQAMANNQPMQQQIWSGLPNSQQISIQQQNNRVGGFIDPLNGQVVRYQPNQNRVVSSSPMMINNTMIAQGNQMQQQQIQHQLNQNIQNQQQIVHQHIQQQPQTLHHQQIAQQNVNQQQMQPNQIHFQQNIIGANGQVITVQQQPQTNNPQNQINVGSMNVITHPDVVMQGENIMQQQRIVMGGQQDDSQGTINRQIQHVGMSMNNNGASVQQQEIIQRIQQQQQIINQSMQIGQPRPEDQTKMLPQFESKNVRHFVPIGNGGAPPNTVFNIRPEGIPHTNNRTMPNAVIMPQHKTPPWQQNKINNIQQNTIQHQNQQVVMSTQQINQQSIQQNSGNVYERVPPLHHHTPPPPVWTDDANRKKNKISKPSKKQRPYNIMDHHQRITTHEGHLACPNIDVRQIPNEHHRSNQQLSQETSSPSFMEDPSGYLAQQTALLNSTISRQTGINNGVNFLCRQGPATPPQNNSQISTSQPSGSPVAVPLPSNMQQPKQIQCYTARSSSSLSNTNNVKIQQNSMSPIQQNMNNSQIEMNSPVNSMMQTSDCQSCVTTSQMGANQYQQYATKVQNEHQKQYQISRPNSHPSTPTNSMGMKDDPVTSSNYNDKFTNVMSQQSPDLRPIQGGTISTSDGSPMEFQPQSSSPSPTTSIKNASTPNMILSNSSPQFVMPSHHSPGLYAVSTSRNPSSNYSQTVPHSLTMTIATNNNVQKSQSYSMQPSPPTNVNLPTSQTKIIEGYCPPPHAAGGLDLPVPYQPRTVTTMASGRTFGSNTITSVLAGRAQTATVSVNTPAVVPTLGIPNTSTNFQQNVQCPQASNSVNISKSPLEMVQSVVSSIQVPHSQNTLNAININTNQAQISPQQIVKSTPSQGLPPGHILVSSGGGQLIMTNNGQATMMPPPPPKIVTNTSSMPPISVSPLVTNVTGAVTQVIPTVGMAQQVLGQQTVLVNALPGPFVIQPGVMAVDGMTVGQNMQLPQIVTGNVIQHQIQLENNGEQGRPPSQGFNNRPPTLISPDGGKRKGKKRKMGSQTVASMLHVAAQQNSGVVMQQQAGFSPQGFQMAHSPQGVNAGPVLQALTIVPGKGGAPPQIVMNGQASTTSPFGTQQLITNSQPTQQINLLQPVNLLNNTTGMVQNFPTIQQFIVPGLGGMVMATDGSGTATLLPDTPSVGMQLQLQNVNGQNVLTPVQNHGSTVFGTTGGQSILAAGPAGMVIRTPASSQGKLIQQQHSPGAQFLSPNGGQFVMNGAQFNGQLSPLVASVSPSQQVTVRPNSSVQQEFIQCGQMGQTLMVPCTPSNPQTIAVSTASGQQNTTFVQQNTTIVQQQTTMVSNNPQIQNFPNGGQNVVSNTQNINNNINGMNMDQNFVMNNNNNNVQGGDGPKQNVGMQQPQQSMNAALLMQRHSVSTQTAVGQSSNVGTTVSAGAGSPPDTTTHSPLAPGADTTTHEGTSPSPPNCTILRDHQPTHSMAMVHCVSSSEPDAADISTDWSRCSSAGSATPKSADCTDFTLLQTNTHFGNGQQRKSLTPTYVESTVSILSEVNMKQDSVVSSQKPIKRKHSDTLVMETRQMRSSLQDDDTDESRSSGPGSPVVFAVGDLVWGAARGCPAWPGKLVDGPNSCDGRVWVRWFGGDRTPMAVDPATLQTLTQGLDAHHRARKKCRKSRKLNAQLENAIQEAMAELDRISEQHQKQTIDSSDSSQSITKSHLETKNLISQSPFKKDATRLRSSQK